ncbi:biotin-dependent carboxyltransferase family protein [Branchiibius sp. NY16-3462-2]|uniref:5-oxoprolinase subunit C family protein n=1 Tax=Branchiibius sp. NY16-3462-2 TaxID=1807500 RepID=UPI0007995335|nr:biotin-dependent carboxyltransferase family protein [Branchiibius sp. NY16-3462-2]KYH46059.1 hypothetical protein AZH51_10455 [Branchiibius sp. NY16-3462-2]
MNALRVIAVGPQALIEDLGRTGHLGIGVAPSGAIDGPSLRAANRVLGNPESAAGVEILLGGVELQADSPVVVVVTGAPAPVTVDGNPAPFGEPLTLGAESTLTIGRPTSGLRSYLAVRGGIEVTETLGSRSTDTSSGLGPTPVQPGDRLVIGPAPSEPVNGDPIPPLLSGPVHLTAYLGPRDDLLTKSAKTQLTQSVWRVSNHTDRIGVRLDGPPLALNHTGELSSAPILAGAIQVPPSGQPIVFLNDHPTTGGYPIVACVRREDLPGLGQARPGETVRITLRANEI